MSDPYRDDLGAYLLGALDTRERAELQRHLASCAECSEELDRLRPAADALPGSVEQLEPPAALKAAIMAEVEPEPSTSRPSFSFRLRPALALAVTVLVGVITAFAIAQLGGDESRTLAVTVGEAMPAAGGNLVIEGDEATLRLHDMPDPGGGRVYQVWLQQDDRMVPARTFGLTAAGAGEVALPDLGDADGVYVTRERRGGAQVPSEDPIVSVPL